MITETTDAVLYAAGSDRSPEPPGDDLRDALNAVAELADADREEAVARIAAALPWVDSPGGAGFVAIWLGARVEKGGDPELTGGPVLETMLRWAKTLPEAPEEGELPELTPNLNTALEMLGRSVVAHLARSERLLNQARERMDVKEVLEKAEVWSFGPMWVLALLKMRSGELLVLHGLEAKGCFVGYENISNCFHLFTLLQGVLQGRMPGARRASEELLAMARGGECRTAHDAAWWHYGQPAAVKPELGSSIWGEGSPDEIEKVEGQQVVLLWPSVLSSRTWDSGFFSPVLQAALPRVEVRRELSLEEVVTWRERLGLPAAVKKPWWKVF